MNKNMLVFLISFSLVAIFLVLMLVDIKKNPTIQSSSPQEQASRADNNANQSVNTPTSAPVTNNNSVPGSDNGIILFYGAGCPHCALVEKYIEENGIRNKIIFTEKEVYNNVQNGDELKAKAKACGRPTNAIGVPLLWDGTKCLSGDQNIIDFFKSKTN